jgi:hypothetical protein
VAQEVEWGAAADAATDDRDACHEPLGCPRQIDDKSVDVVIVVNTRVRRRCVVVCSRTRETVAA